MAEPLRHFLLLLVVKNRMALLPAIFQAFVALVDESVGRLRAVVKSASAISTENLEEVSQALISFGKREVLIDSVVDRGLLAGMRVEVGGKVFDGTLKAKLDALRGHLKNFL